MGWLARLWRVLSNLSTAHFLWSVGGGGVLSALLRSLTDLPTGWIIVAGVGGGCLILAGFITWGPGRESRRVPAALISPKGPVASGQTQMTPQQLDTYIESLKDVLEKHGFGREPPVPAEDTLPRSRPLGPPMGQRRQPMPVRLKGAQRDQLRGLIRRGEELQKSGATSPLRTLSWDRQVDEWLRRHSLSREADRLTQDHSGRSGDRLSHKLVDMRLVLISQIPPGITVEHTDAEAFDRWMEAAAIPEEKRADFRKRWKALSEMDEEP